MLESDAKTKCCFQSVATLSDQACIGSSCMAWRWISPENTDAMRIAIAHKTLELSDANTSLFDLNNQIQLMKRRIAIDYKETEGYCGLAGPQ